jgi:hypothetical protein
VRIALRKRQLVRLHQWKGPSFEGILVERPCRANSQSYVLTRASMLQAEDNHVELADEIEIPEDHVMFLERIRESA